MGKGDQNPSKLIVYSVDKDLNFKNESSPIILSAAISSDNSTLTVTMSEAVVNAASNGSALEASDFSLSISGGYDDPVFINAFFHFNFRY